MSISKSAITKIQAIVIAVIVIVALVTGMTYFYLASTGPSPTPAPSPTPTPAPLREVRIALTSLGPVFLPELLEQKLRYGEEEGLVIRLITTGNDVVSVQALLSGDVEFANIWVGFHPANLIESGQEVRVVWLRYQGVLTGIWVQDYLKDKVKSPADLKGLKIGVSRVGAGTWALAAYLLGKYGVGSADVVWVGLGGDPQASLAAFEGKQVDALCQPWFTLFLVRDKVGGFPLVDFSKHEDLIKYFGGEKFPESGLITRASLIATDRELIKSFIKVFLKLHNYIQTHTAEELYEILSDYLKAFTKEQAIEFLQRAKAALCQDGFLSKEDYEFANALFYETGVARALVPYERAVDMSPLQEVLGS